MRKIILFIFLLVSTFGGLFSFVPATLAQNTSAQSTSDCQTSDAYGSSVSSLQTMFENCANGHGVDIVGKSGARGVNEFRDKVISFIEHALQYAALFAVAALVISGLMYVTAYGADDKLSKAKKVATYALMGLFVVLISMPFISIFVKFLYSLVG